eukprot:14435004-Ditylum_brightwellii.AAC.1
MPRCCGVASIDEAKIPYNDRAPCVRVLKSKPVKRGWTLWCSVDFVLGFCFDFTLTTTVYKQATVNIMHGA